MIRHLPILALAFYWILVPGAVAQPDPSEFEQYNIPCSEVREWNGTRAKIIHATTGDCTTAVPGPLVVLIHGRGLGYDYQAYNYLLEHLALNGFIAVSIDVEHETGVNEAMNFMRDLAKQWSKSYAIDWTNVGLIGHSRGGETIVHLAEAMANPGPGDPPWSVGALVGLASVVHDRTVGRTITGAYMLVHGTVDGDQPALNSFRLYDGASGE